MKSKLLKIANATGVFQLARAMDPRRLYVLGYHRVDYPEHRPWLDPDLLSATPDEFERQMALLAEQFNPVSVDEITAAVNGTKSLPRYPVLVTVDDGYRDFQEHVHPITSRYGIKPILFVPTAFPGSGGFWWDKLFWAVAQWDQPVLETPMGAFRVETTHEKENALKQLRAWVKQQEFSAGQAFVEQLNEKVNAPSKTSGSDVLQWDELRALAIAGVCVAPHTHSHPLLTRISLSQACSDIDQSLQEIEKHLQVVPTVFAYPDGQPDFFSADLMKHLQRRNIHFAVTTVEGSACLERQNALAFPRIEIYPEMSAASFQYRLSPLYQ